MFSSYREAEWKGLAEEELRVRKIKQGTVIDHITGGHALDVLRILGISGREGDVVSVLLNVPSRSLRRKDIVKIEGREIKPREIDEIALIAPDATINIIRNFEVAKKDRVKLPEVIRDVLRCVNPGCITNTNEPAKSIFYVQEKSPLLLRCHYCGGLLEKEDILKRL